MRDLFIGVSVILLAAGFAVSAQAGKGIVKTTGTHMGSGPVSSTVKPKCRAGQTLVAGRCVVAKRQPTCTPSPTHACPHT